MPARLDPSSLSSDSPDINPWQVVATFAPFLRIAHHVPGRVRLKLDLTALDQPFARQFGGDGLKTALGTVRGVHDISLNLLARSCVIAYDNAVIPDAAWPDLLAARRTPATLILIDILQERYKEMHHGQL